MWNPKDMDILVDNIMGVLRGTLSGRVYEVEGVRAITKQDFDAFEKLIFKKNTKNGGGRTISIFHPNKLVADTKDGEKIFCRVSNFLSGASHVTVWKCKDDDRE